MSYIWLFLVFLQWRVQGSILVENNEMLHKFPKSFKFGAATAAFQIEGAWNLHGKGPSIWDTLTHDHPHLIADNSSADVGPDSYHLYLEDIKALKEVGMNFYRFSISWARVLPDGDTSSLNQDGIDYYNRLINALILNGIEPVVTMYHYDLPQTLQDLGGLTNPLFVKYFSAYAEVLYSHFGDRIKRWITFNEPFDFCIEGYGSGDIAPLISVSGVGEYLCGHHVLQAHAAAYNLYKKEFNEMYHGKVGITLDSKFFYAKHANDTETAQRAMNFMLGWFAHPIFSEEGGYPQVMMDTIEAHSMSENRSYSRLPRMSNHMKNSLKGSADFLGLNYYTSALVELSNPPNGKSPSWERDALLSLSYDPNWPRAKSEWLYSVPMGIRGILKWIRDSYNNIEVLITENGWSDDGELMDHERVNYLKQHLEEVLKALTEDNCNVSGYTVWSIIDNFEWMKGYTERFGIYHVDFENQNRTRTAKLSASIMRNIIKTRRIPMANQFGN